MKKRFLSTSEYAKKHKISRMQVIRNIRMGKVLAQRVGNGWMIINEAGSEGQIALEKTTSLQKWNKIIAQKLHKSLKIEESKDRELIYSRLHSLGLPHERCFAFQLGKFPTKTEFEIAVGRIGMPYWISAVPDIKARQLNRLTKLGIYTVDSGWKYVNALPEKEKYKLIVSQYPDKALFKGSVLISPDGKGVAEFITGDRHYIMTRGFTVTDPMLFDQDGVVRFSKTITQPKQKQIFKLVRGIFGHLEVQYGQINNKNCVTFFDYNEEEAYVEIDQIWKNLVEYYAHKRKKQKQVLYGMPASPGKAEGRCIVLHHENADWFNRLKKGDILVADTTTPDMTPMMGKVAAIVTDMGGVTSHAAIVCRELKIPAVVGVGDATERLRTGDVVRVDASLGRIEKIG